MKFSKTVFISLAGILFAQAALADDQPSYPFTSFYSGPTSCQQMLALISKVCPGTRLQDPISSKPYGQGKIYCKYEESAGGWVQENNLNVGDTGYFRCMPPQGK